MEQNMYYITINNGMNELKEVAIKGKEKNITIEKPDGSIHIVSLSLMIRLIEKYVKEGN